jgi:hypothetical protein
MSVSTRTWLSALATGDPDASPFVPVGLYDLTSQDGTITIDKTNRFIFDLSAPGGGGGGGLNSVAHDNTLEGNGTTGSPLKLAGGAGVKTITEGAGIQVAGGTGQNPTIANTGIISISGTSPIVASTTNGNTTISIETQPTPLWTETSGILQPITTPTSTLLPTALSVNGTVIAGSSSSNPGAVVYGDFLVKQSTDTILAIDSDGNPPTITAGSSTKNTAAALFGNLAVVGGTTTNGFTSSIEQGTVRALVYNENDGGGSEIINTAAGTTTFCGVNSDGDSTGIEDFVELYSKAGSTGSSFIEAESELISRTPLHSTTQQE